MNIYLYTCAIDGKSTWDIYQIICVVCKDFNIQIGYTPAGGIPMPAGQLIHAGSNLHPNGQLIYAGSNVHQWTADAHQI